MLASLYPAHGAYVSRVTKAVDDLVGRGFLLREDAQTLLTDASRSGFGK
jgi:Alpha/beta hydrolase domain